MVYYYQSKDIRDFKPVIKGMMKDFGSVFKDTMEIWCEDEDDDSFLWEIFLIYLEDGTCIGVCGLYSLREKRTDELWLSWFGIIPKYRNKGLGEEVLGFLKDTAKELGATKILSYVNKKGKPLPFYLRNGFVVKGTVEDYLKQNPDIDDETFEDVKDYIIETTI